MASASQGYRRMVFAGIASLAAVALSLGAWSIWKSKTRQSHANTTSSGQDNFESKTSGALRNDKEKRPAALQLVDMTQGKEYPKPTREQLEAFIEHEGRSARSLVAAFMLSLDEESWLDEAAERYPNDPLVSATMAMVERNKNNVLSEESIQRMQQNDPKNSLGWCYAALASFKADDKVGGLRALEDAVSRGCPHMYPETVAKEVTKAYKFAGFDAVQAETFGMAHLPMGQLPVLTEITLYVKSDSETGPSLAAGTLLALADSLKQPEGRNSWIESLVSHNLQYSIANATEWYEEVPGTNMMAVELQEKSKQESRKMRALGKEYERLLPSLTDTEMKQYLRRVKVEGEIKAMQWVVQTKGTK